MKLQGESYHHCFTLNARDTTFALTVTKCHIICEYSIMGTEHPKLFIYETQRGHTFHTQNKNRDGYR